MSGILSAVAGVLVGAGAPPPTPPNLLFSVLQGGSAGGVTIAGINSAGANLFVMCTSYYALGTPTMTDTEGNTWTALTGQSAGAVSAARLFYCFNPITAGAHSFDFTGASVYGAGCIFGFSGIASSPFDGENGSTALASTTLSTGSVAPTQAGSLMISVISFDAGSGVDASVGNGFTLVGSLPEVPGGYLGIGVAYKYVTNGASADANWTATGSMTSAAACLGAFKF